MGPRGAWDMVRAGGGSLVRGIKKRCQIAVPSQIAKAHWCGLQLTFICFKITASDRGFSDGPGIIESHVNRGDCCRELGGEK